MGNTRDKNAFPFIITTFAQNGEPKTVARFRCNCGNGLDVPIKATKSLNPEAVCQKARAQGWQSNENTTAVRCPRCTKRKPNDPDELIRKMETKMAVTKDGVTFAPGGVVVTSSQGEKVDLTKKPPLSPEVVVASATVEQRTKVRKALANHFDEHAGRYIGGYTDASLADELKVPRVLVEAVRNAAYGALKEDPVITQLREDIELLSLEIAEGMARQDKMRRTLEDIQARFKAFV